MGTLEISKGMDFWKKKKNNNNTAFGLQVCCHSYFSPSSEDSDTFFIFLVLLQQAGFQMKRQTKVLTLSSEVFVGVSHLC